MTRSGRIRKKINTQKYYAAVEGEGDTDDEGEGAEPGDMDDYKPESDTEEVVAMDDEVRYIFPLTFLQCFFSGRPSMCLIDVKFKCSTS